MAIDLAPADLDTVKEILGIHVPECEVWAFGSRVRRTARKFSDLDLVLIAPGPMPTLRLAALKDAFSASSLPVKVDVVEWSRIDEAFRAIVKMEREIVQETKGE